jgi:hypothetical protein
MCKKMFFYSNVNFVDISYRNSGNDRFSGSGYVFGNENYIFCLLS